MSNSDHPIPGLAEALRHSEAEGRRIAATYLEHERRVATLLRDITGADPLVDGRLDWAVLWDFLMQRYHWAPEQVCNLTPRQLEGLLIAARRADTGKTAHGKPADLGDGRAAAQRWLRPMSLADLANRLGNITTDKARTILKEYGLKNAGNRQTWTVRLDTMPANLRARLEA